jgi:hypothetical protein
MSHGLAPLLYVLMCMFGAAFFLVVVLVGYSVFEDFQNVSRVALRRGFFRLWVVGSAVWSALVAASVQFGTVVYYGGYGGHRELVWGTIRWPLYTPIGAIFMALAPWLASVAVIGVVWVYRGFRPDKG